MFRGSAQVIRAGCGGLISAPGLIQAFYRVYLGGVGPTSRIGNPHKTIGNATWGRHEHIPYIDGDPGPRERIKQT